MLKVVWVASVLKWCFHSIVYKHWKPHIVDVNVYPIRLDGALSQTTLKVETECNKALLGKHWTNSCESFEATGAVEEVKKYLAVCLLSPFSLVRDNVLRWLPLLHGVMAYLPCTSFSEISPFPVTTKLHPHTPDVDLNTRYLATNNTRY